MNVKDIYFNNTYITITKESRGTDETIILEIEHTSEI